MAHWPQLHHLPLSSKFVLFEGLPSPGWLRMEMPIPFRENHRTVILGPALIKINIKTQYTTQCIQVTQTYITLRLGQETSILGWAAEKARPSFTVSFPKTVLFVHPALRPLGNLALHKCKQITFVGTVLYQSITIKILLISLKAKVCRNSSQTQPYTQFM